MCYKKIAHCYRKKVKQVKIIKNSIIFCLFFFLAFPLCATDNKLEYCVPNKLDKTQGYIIKLLKHAMKVTNQEYGTIDVVPHGQVADSISRRIRQVVRGKVSVVWAVTSPELEKELVPVRIPLHKGVYGFRLFLIKKKDQPHFDQVTKIRGLRDFIIGQAHDSREIEILEYAGFNVEKSSSYDGTFKMLTHNRFDCLPKSISEIFIELEQFSKQLPSLKIEDNLLLYYHQPVYFFFKDKMLAKRANAGLEKMIKDGSFDDYFNAQYENLLVKANVAGRRILRIESPIIETHSLPVHRKEFWHSIVDADECFKVIINLSGKQRMLTQKMSKDILLISGGIDVESSLKSLKESSGLFDQILKGLRNGSKKLHLPPTMNNDIIMQLDKVEALWKPFYDEIKAIIQSGKVTADQVSGISQENISILEEVDKCVWLYEAESGKVGVTHDPFLASAINLAGRQRMLSQKMTKEYLLVAYKHKVLENQLLLQQTHSLFDHTLNGLIYGDAILHLKSAEKPHILKQLLKIRTLWNKFKPILEEVTGAVMPDYKLEVIESIAVLNLQLLNEVEIAVEMYEQEAG